MDSQEKLSVKGKLSYQDYMDFQVLHNKNKNLLQFVNLFVIFMLTVLIVSSFNVSDLPMYIVIGLMVSGLFTLVTAIFATIKYKNVFKSDRLLQKEYSYFIGNDGIGIESEVGKWEMKWSDVYQAKQNHKLHSILIAKNKALIIPRSFFANSEQIKEFETLLRNNLSVKQYKVK
ncbi:YcxB family protein [Paenibacillus sinopodophylli]|uniref:YcxB family protein n=1 Tax=Paenibacillus sinopodophylli TaxID=1837342 RepID=UPI00110CA264|nr:YcxB family protein [Paenibacillus sinopodophylli]